MMGAHQRTVDGLEGLEFRILWELWTRALLPTQSGAVHRGAEQEERRMDPGEIVQ